MDAVRTLLLLPGLDGTDVFFRPLMAALPSSVRAQVVCYPADANSYDELLGPVRAAAAAAGPCWVLGSSFGGPLAVLLAASDPHLVRGLILSATFLRAPDETLARWRFLVVPPVVALVRTVRRVPVWMRPSGDPLRVAKAEVWTRVSARTLAARARAVLSTDVRRVYRDGRHPVLCAAYEADRVVPRACAAEIVDGRRGARLVLLPGGHLGMHADPVPLSNAVAAFLTASTGLDSGAPSV
jgi:pimeloyl-ACP methyl ester carboxylesterase